MKLLLIFMLFFQFSCAVKKQDLLMSKIREARYYLTDKKCDDAISVLKGVKSEGKDDPDWLKTYAGAIACKADWSEINFVTKELSDIDSNGFFGSLASLGTSDETKADSDDYTYLMESIQVLIEPASDDDDRPSTEERIKHFGTRHGGDMSMQALYMVIAEFGKFLAYYGNVNSSGLKGKGSGTNTCLYSYTDFTAVTYVSTGGQTGLCTNTNQGHPDLDTNTAGVTTKIRNRRLCQGIILYNNLMDILGNISLVGGDTLASLDSVEGSLSLLALAATTLDTTDTIDPIFDFTNIDECVDFAEDDIAPIERFYALYFETIFQST